MEVTDAQLKVTEARLRQAVDRTRFTFEVRDNLIRLASEQGWSRRKVAAATGLSAARIQQIVDG